MHVFPLHAAVAKLMAPVDCQTTRYSLDCNNIQDGITCTRHGDRPSGFVALAINDEDQSIVKHACNII